MKPEWCPQDVWEVADDLVENYGFHDVREQTNVTDVWAVEDDLHRQAIARALLEAEQRGRRMGMEEGAKVAAAMPGYMQPRDAADVIRAKLDEVQK
ncbi:hypothetical protein NO932_06385 [Pelagibacterium sp. 26DY04]|uniref:hypothetical protein n=1 Tax=Pelagibacterium sp. 26DY04 TaxID=2967130 RepID=UPI00281542ED|nr:hypothetical protein [Pelagibacterium sp. 26DY04]WMT88232.1 hypothetical protein NO932_06385 [Pelagibacterium sp. 26DY04]